jgi:hypothetical protein
MLDKYQELNPGNGGLSGASRRVWKRLKWDQTEITRFQQRISGNIHIFNLFLTSLNRYVTIASMVG